jgi:GGDEF domain-containing protein
METTKNNRSNSLSCGSLIAALCIVIYLFALVQGFVRIYLNIEQRREISCFEFNRITELAVSAGRQGFMDERFIQTMNNALLSTKSIEALIITGADRGHAFEKKKGHAITWVNNSPRFINRFNFSSQSHYNSLPELDIRNANIKAVSSLFDYNEFLRILRETLFIIMIGFTISFITMLLQLLLGKPEKLKGEMIYVPVNEAPEQHNRQNEKTIYPHETKNTGTEPKGLYSPRSNIGWEEYTKDRLDSEIHRCASTEKDLALLLLEFSDMDNELLFRQAAEEAVNFFTSRDLLFEYGRLGITVILPGAGLDIAIGKAERFYQRVMEKFVNNNSLSVLNIGLSSRSGRLLNADRLMLEAGEALKKARNDSKSSIIAFKSDPDKYRDFIRTHS